MISTKAADALAAAKKQRDRNAALVQQQNDAGNRAMLDKTARLRALRLAKEAADALDSTAKKPVKKAAKD